VAAARAGAKRNARWYADSPPSASQRSTAQLLLAARPAAHGGAGGVRQRDARIEHEHDARRPAAAWRRR
jgi:hypothetical protein